MEDSYDIQLTGDNYLQVLNYLDKLMTSNINNKIAKKIGTIICSKMSLSTGTVGIL